MQDLVDIKTVNPSILIDVRYATKNNFTKQILYPVANCYLRKKVALKLDCIQKKLEKEGLGLKIFDGYRPLSIQEKLWEVLPDTRYVADPKVGSKHNRGAAVDVTLVDHVGCELLMPTGFDVFSEKAHRDYQELPEEILENRKHLEDVMVEEGFIPLPTEWWHFDDEEWKSYPLIDISFADLQKSVC